MDNKQTGRTIRLIPPSIHDAADGGLGYDDLVRNPGRMLVVQTGPWGTIVPGDVVDVLWGPDEAVIGSHRYESMDNLMPPVLVAAERFSQYGEGVMQLAARIRLVDTGEVYKTESVPVLVKFSVPGGLDPNPETVHRNESLAAPRIEPVPLPDDLEGINVVIPPYQNMAEGDRITLQWHTNTFRRENLRGDEIGRDVVFPIDKSVAMSGAGQEIAVRYQVHDLVANWSLWSPESLLTTPPGESAPPPPWILGTVDDSGDTVDLDALAGKDLIVRVENRDIHAGDEVSVTWEGMTDVGKRVSYTSPPTVIARDGQTVDVPVPNSKVSLLVGSRASADYAVRSSKGLTVRSRKRQVSIQGIRVALPAPMVLESVNGILDPALAANGATIVVPAWDGHEADDRCYIEWHGLKVDGTPTGFSAVRKGSDMGSDGLVFSVASDQVTELAGGSVRIRYTLALQTEVFYRGEMRIEPLVHLESPWLELRVVDSGPPLSINSSPVELSTPIFRLEKPVITPPDGAYVTRVATGGIPPYLYSTADGAVEVDEHTGRVVSLRNGKAVVVVTDARGATASYQVTVSKVCHLVDLGSDQFYQHAAGLAQQGGGRLPWGAEFEAMRGLYAGTPNVDPAMAWCLDGAGNKLQYCVNPNTGAREVRRSYPGVRSDDDDDPARWIPIGKPMQAARAWMVVAVNA
jgi:hypothetical protein